MIPRRPKIVEPRGGVVYQQMLQIAEVDAVSATYCTKNKPEYNAVYNPRGPSYHGATAQQYG